MNRPDYKLDIFVGSTGSDLFLFSTSRRKLERIELEQEPDPAPRPEPDEKLIVKEHNFGYHPGPNIGQARELFGKRDRARRIVELTRLE